MAGHKLGKHVVRKDELTSFVNNRGELEYNISRNLTFYLSAYVTGTVS